jgi:hypothetical protein
MADVNLATPQLSFELFILLFQLPDQLVRGVLVNSSFGLDLLCPVS